MDESIRDLTTSIIRQLNEPSSSLSVPNAASGGGADQINGGTVIPKNSSDSLAPSGSENSKQLNRLTLTINTMMRTEAMTVVFGHADQRLSWEKCFVEAKKVFCKYSIFVK